MSYEELVESGKSIGEMNEDELLEYSHGLLHEVWDYEKKIDKKDQEIERLNNIIDALEKWLSKKDLIIETPMVLDKIQELKDGYGEELSDK